MTTDPVNGEHLPRETPGTVPAQLDPGLHPDLVAEDVPLNAILRSIAASPGVDGLGTMVRELARALGVKYAAVAEFDEARRRVLPLAFWDGAKLAHAEPWSLAGTPCERVLDGEFILHTSGLCAKFPLDAPLVGMKAESYLGVPLMDLRGRVLGHLFVIDTAPMTACPRRLAILRVFAALATGELTRRRLEATLGEAEEQLRDLFDEAPIAYVHEGVDSRFIRANKTALRVLGVRPDQVAGTYGKTFAPDTPEAQHRLKLAFESIGKGIDTSGVVLELRRKDDGKPIWIQWWSRPHKSGTYTRTMFLDITDRVLMEQEQARLQAQNRYLSEELRSSHNFGEIVGSSPALLRVLERVERAAPTDAAVLIEGETGTGKELIARAVHDRSARRAGPFVKVNCAALPAGLVESEFFGHEKGAFTGAVSSRRGRFELADGGTIFLDEVGEVSPEVQVKLLRVLQESEFERVGGSQTIRVNVRVIAATNRDLAADVKAGRFRADLFYRLSVFPVQVPPLRDRPEDIPLLVSFFVTQLATAVGKHVEEVPAETMDRLARYAWPGNIRELRNVLERAVILSNGPVLAIEAGDLPSRGADPAAPVRTLEAAERDAILAALKQTRGAVAGPKGAAKLLGVPPSTLRSRMEKLGLNPGPIE